MDAILFFVLGLVIGANLGVILLSIMIVGRDS